MPDHLFNLLSPYGAPREYVGRQNKGFIVSPASDSATSGWGAPYTDADGNAITPPGTVGGSGARRLLGHNPTSGWRSRKTPGTFLVGNISWQGKLKKEGKPEKGYWVLTYHGPSGRYFSDEGFSYGTADKHNNVYYEGQCITVAPHPVLGAAIRTVADDKREIIVVCKKGVEDMVYARPLPMSGVFSDKYMDSDYRNDQMKLYSADNKDGWRLLGTHTCNESTQGASREVKEASTPWFFDSTGTVAQCMREATITMSRGDKEMEHPGYVRYKLTISGESASFTTMDNETGFTYTMERGVTRYGDYSTVTRVPWNSGSLRMHWWHEWKVYCKLDGTGSYVIAVDYKDTEEMLFTIELHAVVHMTQWMYIGCDSLYDPSMDSTSEGNNGQGGGDWFKSKQTDYVPSQQDGVGLGYLGHNVTYKINCEGFDGTWLYRKLSGTRAEFETGERDEDDPWLYFLFGSLVYPHYVSIPRPHLAAWTEEPLYQYSTRFYAEAEQYYNAKMEDDDAVIVMEKQEEGVEYGVGNLFGYDRGWLYYQIINHWWDGVPETTETFRVLDARFPMDLEYEIEDISPYSFFDGWAFLLDEDWPSLTELLKSSSKNVRNIGIAESGTDHFAVSLEYTDHSGEVKYYNALDNETNLMTSTTGATGANQRFLPLGES
jgi:hypothetical protein